METVSTLMEHGKKCLNYVNKVIHITINSLTTSQPVYCGQYVCMLAAHACHITCTAGCVYQTVSACSNHMYTKEYLGPNQ